MASGATPVSPCLRSKNRTPVTVTYALTFWKWCVDELRRPSNSIRVFAIRDCNGPRLARDCPTCCVREGRTPLGSCSVLMSLAWPGQTRRSAGATRPRTVVPNRSSSMATAQDVARWPQRDWKTVRANVPSERSCWAATRL